MGGWSIPWSDYQPTIGSSFSWIWMNLQDFVWRNLKQKVVWSYNWDFLACIYLNLVTMISNSLGWCRKWVPCKLTYLYCNMSCFVESFEIFIHFPTWSCKEIHRLLPHFIACT
jgi:hypothetical protein